jgi:hypothetical protein
MKHNTLLSLKDKGPIGPDRIEVVDSPAGRTIVFLFPRTANIGTGDKEVSFETSLGPRTLRAKFNLKDMLYRGKLEL